MLSESNILDLENSIYEQYCKEWILQDRLLKEKQSELEKLRAKIVELSGGDRMEYGVKVATVSQKGKIQYKAIVDSLCLDQSVLDKYTSDSVEFTRVTKY